MKTMLGSFAIYGSLVAAVLVWSPIVEHGLMPDLHQFGWLGAAVVIWLFGYQFCGGRFVRPRWKQSGKLVLYLTFSWLFLRWVGDWALFFLVGHQALGWVAHIAICRKHGINWRNCQPEEKYLALTEKWGRGEFS